MYGSQPLGLIRASEGKASNVSNITDRRMSIGSARAWEREFPPRNVTSRYDRVDSVPNEILATGVDEVGDVWIRAWAVRHRM